MDRYAGTVVLNYRLAEKLGEGGFGWVYRARHEDLGRDVAVKVLRPDRASDPGVVERFLREAKLICAIGHRSIVDIENAGRLPTGEPFYVMELVPGMSLAQWLRERGPLDPANAERAFGPISEALSAAHARGIIHRDLKPHNIMVADRDGAIVSVKLLDFGIAKVLTTSDASSTGDMMGTPHFMAPEQALDAKSADARADVYSFAASLFNALAGRRPFEGDTVTAVLLAVQSQTPPRLSQYLRGVPAALDEALDRCMAKRPDDRPSTILDAWETLRAGLQAVPPHARLARRATTATTGPRAGERGGEVTASAQSMTMATTGTGTPMQAGVDTPPPPPRPRWRVWLATAAVALAVVAGAMVAIYASLGPAVRRPAQQGDAAIDPQVSTADLPPTPTEPESAPLVAPPTPVVDAGAPDAGAPKRPPSRLTHRKDGTRPPKATPSPRPPVEPPPSFTEPALVCTRASFAAIYQADSPPPAQVRSALKRLRDCQAKALVSNDDYARIQAALVSKL